MLRGDRVNQTSESKGSTSESRSEWARFEAVKDRCPDHIMEQGVLSVAFDFFRMGVQDEAAVRRLNLRVWKDEISDNHWIGRIEPVAAAGRLDREPRVGWILTHDITVVPDWLARLVARRDLAPGESVDV